ncbi:hypothetical protein [Nocardia jiangsuensis]|uniref:Uncharacterized protein n=1 Tax=Nocardia jiangsuensis TaxID=1691563 RepID=A0ABV8DPS1_9NOCA
MRFRNFFTLCAVLAAGCEQGEPDRREPVPSHNLVAGFCDRLLEFARVDLGAQNVSVARPDQGRLIGRLASCELRGVHPSGVQARALTVDLGTVGAETVTLSPSEWGVPVAGVSPTVLVRRSAGASTMKAAIDGWGATMTLDTDGLRTATGGVDLEPPSEPRYAEFLLTLIREYGQWD